MEEKLTITENMTMKKMTVEKMITEKVITEKSSNKKVTTERVTMEFVITDKPKGPSAFEMNLLFYQDKICTWLNDIKVPCLIVIAFLLYVYLLITLKTIYLKNKRLDRIGIMVAEVENKIHTLEQKLAQSFDDLEGNLE